MNLDNLPEAFDALEATTLELRISNRVVDPLLYVQRESGGITVSVGGRRVVNGVERVLLAPSNHHNWVVDNDTIRPLPQDVSKQVSEVLGADVYIYISFQKAIELARSSPEEIEIRFDDNVFLSAKELAKEFEARINVPGLRADLFPYQVQGVQWMKSVLEQTQGIILADEMGLGKTLQIIALMLLNKPDPNMPALVLCPTSLIANWVREIERFSPSLSVLVHRGPDRGGTYRQLQVAEVVVTTYETMVNDHSIFSSLTWSYLICDEAQALKNPDSERRRSVSGLNRMKAIPVTGTPVENSLRDLWSLLDVAIPGLLGSLDEFCEQFPDTFESANKLQFLTDAYILKRRVSDVAQDLPERIDIPVPLELSASLAQEYCRIREETIEEYPLAGDLVATLQLQLFCAHPWLRQSDEEREDTIDSTQSQSGLVTPKMERLVALLSETFLNRKKVLVFAQFNRCFDLIREAAKHLPMAYWNTINGSTPQDDRQNIIDEFSNFEGPACLVLNPRAAGSGLNITAATVVIHYTPVWNPAIEQQASARAHRRGQENPVTIYKLFYNNTVESVMIDRSAWKSELADESIPSRFRDEDDIAKALSMEPRWND